MIIRHKIIIDLSQEAYFLYGCHALVKSNIPRTEVTALITHALFHSFIVMRFIQSDHHSVVTALISHALFHSCNRHAFHSKRSSQCSHSDKIAGKPLFMTFQPNRSSKCGDSEKFTNKLSFLTFQPSRSSKCGHSARFASKLSFMILQIVRQLSHL